MQPQTGWGAQVGLLDTAGRNFLLGTETQGPARALLDFRMHAPLERLRPALSHIVFVQGDKQTKQCRGIVQLFGTIQLYLFLNDQNYTGPGFAAVALHDPHTREERFYSVDPIEITQPPAMKLDQGMHEWENRLNAQVPALLGESKLILHFGSGA